MAEISDLLVHPPPLSAASDAGEEEDGEDREISSFDSPRFFFFPDIDRPILSSPSDVDDSDSDCDSFALDLFNGPDISISHENPKVPSDPSFLNLELGFDLRSNPNNVESSDIFYGSDEIGIFVASSGSGSIETLNGLRTVDGFEADSEQIDLDSEEVKFDPQMASNSNFLDAGFDFELQFDHNDEIDNEIFDVSNEIGVFVGSSESGSIELSNCLRIDEGFESDSGSEDGRIVPIDLDIDVGEAPDQAVADDLELPPLCWDCLHLEDRHGPDEDFEWEEVDQRSVNDERDLINQEIENSINMAFDASIAGEQSVQVVDYSAGGGGAFHSLEWEVLLAVNNLDHSERNVSVEHDLESYVVDRDDYIYTTEYEVLFGQFTEAENLIRGSPPAAKSIVDGLPSVLLTKADLKNGNVICAVCKDEISLGELAKRLLCTHHYHSDCIVPWLGIRNTCPVCRFEMRTDDPDYELWRSQHCA